MEAGRRGGQPHLLGRGVGSWGEGRCLQELKTTPCLVQISAYHCFLSLRLHSCKERINVRWSWALEADGTALLFISAPCLPPSNNVLT